MNVSKIVSLIDLTRLEKNDPPENIIALAKQAHNQLGYVAAVCIYPEYINLVKDNLPATANVKIATVANFPAGELLTTQQLATELDSIIALQVNEIDLVLPYKTLNAGDADSVEHFLQSARELCPATIKLKIILETGELADQASILLASKLAITAGADFIKTSTGKTPAGASLAAAETMLNTIKIMQGSGFNCGLKVSGGVRNYADAIAYIELAKNICGEEFIAPSKFRIGASSLLADLSDVSHQANF